MFTKVLIPYDFSKDAEYTIRCVQNIPQIREIILVHITRSLYLVSSPERENPETDYARLRLEKISEMIEMPRSRVRVIVREISGGEISDAIIRISEQESASLIIMGRRGRGVIETLLLGSTAYDILRYGKSSLLLIHPPDTLGTQPAPGRCPLLWTRVQICTDFSEPAIETLCTDLYPYVSAVDFVHVVSRGDSDDELKNLTEKAEEQMKQTVKTASVSAQLSVPSGSSVNMNSHVLIGDPADEIIRFSEQQDISLIVVKSTGSRGILHSLIGGTTEAIARHSKKPLLILKNRGN